MNELRFKWITYGWNGESFMMWWSILVKIALDVMMFDIFLIQSLNIHTCYSWFEIFCFLRAEGSILVQCPCFCICIHCTSYCVCVCVRVCARAHVRACLSVRVSVQVESLNWLMGDSAYIMIASSWFNSTAECHPWVPQVVWVSNSRRNQGTVLPFPDLFLPLLWWSVLWEDLLNIGRITAFSCDN